MITCSTAVYCLNHTCIRHALPTNEARHTVRCSLTPARGVGHRRGARLRSTVLRLLRLLSTVLRLLSAILQRLRRRLLLLLLLLLVVGLARTGR